MIKKNVFQLAYISFATDEFDSATGFEPLLEHARASNEKLGITGILLFRGGIFFQLLEGEHENVSRLMHNKIMVDPRHHNVKTIAQSEGNQRIFNTWTMAFKKLEDVDLNRIQTLLPWEELIKKAESGEKLDNDVIKDIIKKIALDL